MPPRPKSEIVIGFRYPRKIRAPVFGSVAGPWREQSGGSGMQAGPVRREQQEFFETSDCSDTLMMPRDNALKHCAVAALLSLVLFTTNALASPQSGQWVRVHHGAELSALASAEVGDRLADYGSFQWGRL